MSWGRSPDGPRRPGRPRSDGGGAPASVPRSDRRSHRQRRRRLSRYTLPVPRLRSLLLVLLGFVLAGLGGAASFLVPALVTAAQVTGHSEKLPSATLVPQATAAATPAPPAGSAFTVLLLGSDNDGKFGPAGRTTNILTQSMVLVRVDPTTHQVTMLSIPRDLWVPFPWGGSGKIDQAYEHAGVTSSIQAVESNFHVHIDQYVWIGLQGLVNLINEVGGIDIVAAHPVMDDDYPYDLTGNDPFAAERVAVLPGPQHMDGEQAMEYSRSRHGDIAEDLGRTVRQQQVLEALRAKLSRLTIGDIDNLASALNGQFLTSIPLTEFGSLLSLAKGVTSSSIQHVYLIQGQQFQSTTIDGQSALQPDWNSIRSLVQQSFPAT